MRPKVVYWNNIPSPYFVGRFNAIQHRDNLDFEAWFNSSTRSGRSWAVDESSWQFASRYIPATSIMGRNVHLPLPELQSVRPDLLVSLYHDPSFILGSLASFGLASRRAFRVLPTFDAWNHRSLPRELAKHVLFRGIDAVKVPGPAGASQAGTYGVPYDRAFPVMQSIDIAHYQTAKDVAPDVRQQGRAQRGLTGCVFVYVGRLWTGKGLNHLLDAFSQLAANDLDVSLLIVGDGPDEADIRQRASAVRNVWFEGFVQPDQIPSIYGLADVLVFPTLGDPHGLVVEEAMAAGLPVISSSAAGDIDLRVRDDVNGYVVPVANVDALQARMMQIASDERHRRSLGENAREVVLSRSHDRFAEDFERFVFSVLACPPRAGVVRGLTRAMGLGVRTLVPVRRQQAAFVSKSGQATKSVSLPDRLEVQRT